VLHHENCIMLLSFHCFLLYFTSNSCLDGMLSPSFYSVLIPIKMVENIVIKELLDSPFSVHPLHTKLRIVISVLNLLHQPTAPYHMHTGTMDISLICFSIGIPSSGST
jgi:hypothetical protein